MTERTAKEAVVNYTKTVKVGQNMDDALYEVLKNRDIWQQYILQIRDIQNKTDDSLESYHCFCESDNCNKLEPFVELRKFVRERFMKFQDENETEHSNKSNQKFGICYLILFLTICISFFSIY